MSERLIEALQIFIVTSVPTMAVALAASYLKSAISELKLAMGVQKAELLKTMNEQKADLLKKMDQGLKAAMAQFMPTNLLDEKLSHINETIADLKRRVSSPELIDAIQRMTGEMEIRQKEANASMDARIAKLESRDSPHA